MKLSIESGIMYADGLFVCFVGVGNGRDALQSGRYPCEATYSHTHGKNLVRVDGIGWAGASPECDIVLGRVRNRDDVLPCPAHERRVLALVETAQDYGSAVELVVK